MHEAGLQIGADHHAEPDQVDAERVGGRRQQRNDDEGDLEKVEEEGDDEDEEVDETRKPTTPPGSEVSMPSIQWRPLTPWKTRVKTRAPSRMKTTMAVRRMVDIHALR